MSHDVLCTLQDSTVLVCSGYVVNGSVVSDLVSDVGVGGTEHSQHPWSPMEKWNGDLSAAMEYHGELGAETLETWQRPWSPMEKLVWKPVNTHGVPCRVGERGHSHGVP